MVSFLYTSGVATSLLQSVQDWSSRFWTFQYDAHNYMTTMTTPLGCKTMYAYAPAGSTVTLVQAITDPLGYTTSYVYDSNQRVVQMHAGSATWSYAYNVGLFGPSATSNVVATSPSGAVTTTTYDSQGNVGNIQRPEGYTSTFAYDQTSYLRISETVPAGVVYSMAYNQSLWLPAQLEDALNFVTTMQYDSHGNLTTHIAADSGTTTYAYYGGGATRLLASTTDPIGRVSAYSYTNGWTVVERHRPSKFDNHIQLRSIRQSHPDYGKRWNGNYASVRLP